MKTKFNLSHYKNLTFSGGELVPIMAHEVLPGDLMQHYTDSLIRVSPLLTPVMHPVRVKIHHFYVPFRILWDDWEDFITGGDDGNDASVFPQITITPTEGTLADYLGLPIGTSISVSALYFRAYAKIWNEYFRDKDLQTELTIDTTSGADSTTNTTLQNRCWEKDFFTTCRATEQKGADVTLPLGTKADVATDGTPGSGNNDISVYSSSAAAYRDLKHTGTAGQNTYIGTGVTTAGDALYADLTNATAATINQIRTAFAEQRFKEARSRYGNDDKDYLRWLGVNSSDGRLQKPEQLASGSQTISFSEIVQNGPDFDSNGGVGTLRGHGIAAMRSNRYKKYFEEHGVVMSLMSIMPKTMYTDGVAHQFLKNTKEEFFQREYEHVGQRAVTNNEIYAAHSSPTDTFGYQDRYDEYRQSISTVAGEFRSTLSEWHMARDFSSDPSLNAAFVKANPTNRIFASTSTDQFQVMAYHSMQARRLLSSRSR